jgi:hypothetical protein
MLIIALVLALIGLVALVFAVVTSNELVAWVCIGASILGVVLLIIDALRERQRRDAGGEDHEEEAGDDENALVDYPEEVQDEQRLDAAETMIAESYEAGTEPSEESAVRADGRGEDPAK